MVYIADLKSADESHVGSSPTTRTSLMRSSYSGNTLAFQARAEGSIPLLRSTFGHVAQLDRARAF